MACGSQCRNTAMNNKRSVPSQRPPLASRRPHRSPRVLFVVPFLLLALTVGAVASEPRHDLVSVRLDDPTAAEFIRNHQGELDIVLVKPGVEAQIAAEAGNIEALTAAGLAPQLLQADMERANEYPDKGIGFGVYHTYSENVAFIDSLRLRFPAVVSGKWSIGTTVEGRDIWAFRVSDNPDLDEDEPEVLIDGMHHANEIITAEFPIMFAEYLAMNYGSDPEITWLVDHRELYLVPIVNPDGVVWNESTSPDGGGTWTKNRHNYGGVYGVNLNRNYPYQCGYDDDGSSPTPSSEGYRGPSPASEPETQAMRAFVAGREIVTHNSLHAYGGMILHPWGYAPWPAPADGVFSHMAREMAKTNGYVANQMCNVLGIRNGVASDTYYGDTVDHAAIFSLTTEMGRGCFGAWPPESQRGSIFQENVWPNVYLMRVAGPFVAVHTPVVSAAAKAVSSGTSGLLDFTIENQSVVASATGASVTVQTDDPWIQLLAAERTVGMLPSRGSTTLVGNPLPFTVDAACPVGHQVQVVATVRQDDGVLDFPLSFTVGVAPVVFSDNFENGTGNWTRTGAWDLVMSSSHTASHSLADTPGATSYNSWTYAQLNGSRRASKLRFWHKYNTEATWDVACVQVSAYGGPWTTLEAYSGSHNYWSQVTIDLGAYAGSDLAFRFVMTTDYSLTYDGWYIDDVELVGDPLVGFAMAPPAAGAPVAFTRNRQPVLTVANSPVPGGGAAVYGFRIYRDALCTDLAASVDNVAETAGRTSWTGPALADGSYWWRAWAGDGTRRTTLSAAEPFVVTAVSAVTETDLPGLHVLDGVGGDGARIELSLPSRADVTLDVHDARGARVRRVFAGSLAEGNCVLSWDGRDDAGRTAASGVYFLNARVGDRNLQGRVVIVR